jgi:hypothetical protein
MNIRLPRSSAGATLTTERAEAHLLRVAVIASLLGLLGLPAGLYVAMTLCSSMTVWGTLAVLLYVGFLSTICYWLWYRARNPRVRVRGQSYLIWTLVCYAVGVALLAAYMFVLAAQLASRIDG